MTFSYSDFLKRLKEVKLSKKIKNEEISKISGVPVSTVAKILSGNTPDPKIGTMMAIADALNVSIDYLVYGNIEDELLSDQEKEIIKKYRQLTTDGKMHIIKSINFELSEQAQEAESKEEHLA